MMTDQERLHHLQFPCRVRADRIPLVFKAEAEWMVLQPDWAEGTIAWTLPAPWQEWLENDGRWAMEALEEEGAYVLHWVTDGSMRYGSQASQEAQRVEGLAWRNAYLAAGGTLLL